MRDINLELRQAYYSLLNGHVNVTYTGKAPIPVPVYYLQVPKNYLDFYIVIQSINSVGRESKNDTDVEISIQFAIYTRIELNSGWECDQIANQIYQICYQNREQKILGFLSTELVSDNTLGDLDAAGVKQIVERYITFSHIKTI